MVTSAGLLMWRRDGADIEVLLVHPGGPYWAKKDEGAWSLPKGEVDDEGADPLATARREFEEELGTPPPDGAYVTLGEARLKSGKLVLAWAVEGDIDASTIASNTFEIEWPPKSGKRQSFPEVDRAEWFGTATASAKLNAAQVVFVERLRDLID